MAVIRVEKTKNYTVMSNEHLRDKTMSLKAKGLLSEVLSLDDKWEYSVSGLTAINKEGRDAIRATLKELEDCGYLKIINQRDDKGQFKTIYVFFETKRDCSLYKAETHYAEAETDEPQRNNRVGFSESEEPTQRNTKERNTKERNTDKECLAPSPKKTLKEKYADMVNNYITDFNFSDDVKEKIYLWYEYKAERKDKVAPLGVKQQLVKLDKVLLAYPERDILEAVDESIERGYAAMFYEDSLKKKNRYENNQQNAFSDWKKA